MTIIESMNVFVLKMIWLKKKIYYCYPTKTLLHIFLSSDKNSNHEISELKR